jgi:hypothetical protein
MLSRAQEARVRDILGGRSLRAVRTYCLEHLATVAYIPHAHLADLAAFVRAYEIMGSARPGMVGCCEAQRHQTRHLLVWATPTQHAIQGRSPRREPTADG